MIRTLACLVVATLFCHSISSAGSRATETPPQVVGTATIPLIDSARAAHDARDWPRSLELHQRLVEENPYNGRYQNRKATALYFLGDFEAAAQVYKRVLELGDYERHARFALGYCYLAMEDPATAARWFTEFVDLDPSQIARLKRDPDVLALHADYLEDTFGPVIPDDLERDAGWALDLDYLLTRIQRSHFDPFRKTPREVWQERADQLRSRIPQLTDRELYGEFMKIVALAGDGHTNIWPANRGRFEFRMLPIYLYPFQDGFHVLAAAEEYSDLVGVKVIGFGNVEIGSLFEQIEVYEGHENLMHRRLLSPPLLANTFVLRALAATESLEKATLRFVGRDGRPAQRSLTAVPLEYSQLSLRDRVWEWTVMNHRADRTTPLWLRRPKENYWFEYDSDRDVLYFQFNRVADAEQEPFDSFSERLFDFVETENVGRLVIDIRLNDGGSTDVYRPLFQRLLESPVNERGRLFTIIGRGTYSAAMNLAVDLEYWSESLFVGEPTSSAPNFIGENQIFTLPYSDIRVSVSDRYHQRGGSNSTDQRIWIAPDLIAELTSDQFRNNFDPAMEAIRTFVSASDSDQDEESDFNAD